MATSEGLILGAGALAFGASFKEAGGFPPNGYAVIGGTVALTFIASFTGGSVLAGPVKGLAALMLLGAAIRYIPNLSNTKD